MSTRGNRLASKPTPAAAKAAGAAPKVEAKVLRFAVVDSFQQKKVDLDGDAIPDVSHGEAVTRYVSSAVESHGKNAVFETFDKNKKDVASQFDDLASQIRGGKLFDGINVSLTLPVPVVGKDGQVKKSASGEPVWGPANPANVSRLVYMKEPQKQAALEKAIKNGDLTADQKRDIVNVFMGLPSFSSFDNLAKAAEEKGIPLSLAAGNTKEELNLFSLLPSVTAVGSLNANGKESAYSSRSTHVTAHAQGVYNSRTVAGGFDITADGKADFSPKDLSRWHSNFGPQVVSKLEGKRHSEVAATEADYQAIAAHFTDKSNFETPQGESKYPNGNLPKVVGKVFETEKLAQAIEASGKKTGYVYDMGMASTETTLRELSADRGGYVSVYSDADQGAMLFAEVRVKSGVVKYDPADDGKGPPSTSVVGTSFAAPTWLGHEAARRADARATKKDE